MIRKANPLVILGFGLCLASPTHAQQADSSSPDLVLINGKVLTMDDRSSVVEALAVLDGKILATGSNASVKSIISARTRVLDLAGKTVVPGLIDTHAHFKAAGLSEYVVSMSRAKTVVEALDAIKTFAAKKNPGEWIVGGAWHPPSQLAEKRYLTKQEIDGVAPNNPVYRAGLMFRPEPPADMAAWETVMSGNGASSGFGDDWLKFAGIKIFYDGGMTLKTALTRDVYPDSHDDYRGIAQQTPERLKQLVSICSRYNWRVGVHVVGDLGIDHVLDAFEAADREKSIRDRRFILIHASLIRPEQMERAHRLGARVDFQNVFMWDKAATVERFLGRATADRAVPTKTLIERMGINSLGAGTDFPVNPINPLLNMYIMVTRKDPNGNVYGASEAISREQALRLYTSAAARYTFEEERKGTLEPGKLADLVVLSADYVAVPEDQIKDIKADVTIVGGKIVFQR
jgi:predicted amidohydrolase YtcJ